MVMSRRQAALAHGWRSGLEEDVAESLTARGVTYSYESLVIEWTPEAKVRKYTPDFVVIAASGKRIIIETKGRWVTADRMKMKAVVAQHPELDIRMVFQSPYAKIAKTSTTTYAGWCERHLGIPWARLDVPTAWIME
jgi:hypothetical protein